MRRPTATALALFCLLALTASAQAKNDPVGSGQTKLRLEQGFSSFLAKNAIELSAKAGARRQGPKLLLSTAGGSLDPTTGKGSIDLLGTLSFEARGKKVPLREITVKTKHAPLIAKVGGSQLKVATAKEISTKREGFGSAFEAKALQLTAKAATRLNKKLRPKIPFSEGQLLGTLSATTQPETITILERNKATLVFDPSFLAKLESRFVSLNPIFPAEHVGPSFTFPIAVGGAIAPDGSQGTLRTAGELELLQLGGAQLFWREGWLDLAARSDSAEADLEPTPAFPGKLGRVGVFDLAPTQTIAEPKARTIAMSGGALSLSAQGAGQLNQAFGEGVELFRAGDALGVLGFVAVGQ